MNGLSSEIPAPHPGQCSPEVDMANLKGGSLLRQVVEFLVSLCLAVTLFKAFAAEGYLISTGSMAPTLLGHHRNVICPGCRYEFEINFSQNQRPVTASCPNCTLTGIRTDNLVRQDGDQLLVNRSAYEYREPRRWEVVVFRNPGKRTEAYVKRVVGFPGEKIQLQRGDLVVNGIVQRKPYVIQKSLRLLVHDSGLSPHPTELPWRPRWRVSDAWREEESGFLLTPSDHWSKLEYEHWIRIGGNYITTQPLAKLPEGVALPAGSWFPVEYKEDRHELLARGVMSEGTLSRLTGLSPQADYQEAVRALYEASHLSPVGDFCAYNAPNAAATNFVPDLMVSCLLEYQGGAGALRCVIDSGRGEYFAEFDFTARRVSLWKSGDQTALRSQSFSPDLFQRAALMDFSVFDQQALLVVNGQTLLEPVPFRNDTPHVSLPRRPVRFEGRNLSLRLTGLKLFRDVYYTAAKPQDRDKVYTLEAKSGGKQYFFLGDNSPVSVDSRFWGSQQKVDRNDFLGQPFLVHLPARTYRWKIGSWKGDMRVPDFSRIRYIR